ncbi:MAG: sulfotransferase [Luteimonas sp.]|nr:sulfotransferase [Luteimonas sp.]
MSDPAQAYARAVDALNRGQWQEARSLGSQLLKQAPGHAGVHFVAGVAALQLQLLHDAVPLLKRATVLNPQRADYLAQLARAFVMARLLGEACQAADAAFQLSPEDPLTLDTLGVVFTQAHAHDKAAQVFRKAVEMMPQQAGYRFNLATSLMYSGDIDAAEREYEACISTDPSNWKAHLALAQQRRQLPESNHVDALGSLLAKHENNPDASLYLNLALAKEFEDLGQYPKAFGHYVQGKASQRAMRNYSVERDREVFQALMSAPGPQPADRGSESAEPIFIFGMPRSGTTLVDRIISSHSQVQSAGELQEFGLALKRMSGSRTNHLLDVDTIQRAAGIDMGLLGKRYIDSTRPAGTGATPRFIDKLPHNFLYAGFIARALPNARMICLHRDPLDTCLSNFRQLFALRSPYYDYSFDLLDTGRYYILYRELISHWHRTMPGRILEISYESIVDGLEGKARELLEFCGLPWERACLAFEENQAPVATASAVQVREPINRKSVGRWRRYESELAELRELLRNAGIEN